MAGLGVPFELRLLDKQSILYESMAQRMGREVAEKAFYRALNHEGRKALTQVKKDLVKATSIRYGDVSKALSTETAYKGRLRYKIEASGRAIPLGSFAGVRQSKKGVTAKVWGRKQHFKSAFIVASLGRQVFKNVRGWNKKAGRYNQIEKLFGPSIPEEMMKPAVTKAFHKAGDGVYERAKHELNRILNGL